GETQGAQRRSADLARMLERGREVDALATRAGNLFLGRRIDERLRRAAAALPAARDVTLQHLHYFSLRKFPSARLKPAGFWMLAMCAASGIASWRAPGTFAARPAISADGPPRWSSAPLRYNVRDVTRCHVAYN